MYIGPTENSNKKHLREKIVTKWYVLFVSRLTIYPFSITTTHFQAFLSDRYAPYAMRPLSILSVCGVGVLWRNGWTDQDATWYRGISLGPGDIVLYGDPAPPTERSTAAPTFQPVYCGQTVAHLSNCWALVLLNTQTMHGNCKILFCSSISVFRYVRQHNTCNIFM